MAFWIWEQFGELLTPEEVARFDSRWIDDVVRFRQRAKYYADQHREHQQAVEDAKRELAQILP